MKLQTLAVYKPVLLTSDRTTFNKYPYFSYHAGHLDSILCELLKLWNALVTYRKEILHATGDFLRYIFWGKFPFLSWLLKKTRQKLKMMMWYVFFMALLMGLSKCSACWFIFVLVALVLAHKQRTRDLLFKLHFKLLHKLMVVFQQKKIMWTLFLILWPVVKVTELISDNFEHFWNPFSFNRLTECRNLGPSQEGYVCSHYLYFVQKHFENWKPKVQKHFYL